MRAESGTTKFDLSLDFEVDGPGFAVGAEYAVDLFDALGSREKTLHANTGGHTGVPQFEGDDANRFFVRHLT